MLSSIAERLRQTPSFSAIIQAIRSGSAPFRVSGLTGSARSVLVSLIYRECTRTTVIICADQAEAIRDDIESLIGGDEILYFPDWEILPYDDVSPHEEIVGTRLQTLTDLLKGKRGVVVVPLRALLRKILPPADLLATTLTISRGMEIPPEEIIGRLVEVGYSRSSLVEVPGTFSMRGGILDIYCQSADNPVRIEFFGNRIESLREFDPISQRSIKKIQSVTILPFREVPLCEAAVERFLKRIGSRRLNDEITTVIQHVKERFFFDGIEAYAPYFYSEDTSLLSYLPEDAIYVVLEPDAVESKSEEILSEAKQMFEHRHGNARLLPLPENVFARWGDLVRKLRENVLIEISALRNPRDRFALVTRSPDAFGGRLGLVRSQVYDASRQGYHTFIMCDNLGQAERLEDIISSGSDYVTVAVGTLSQGFVFPEARLQVITDREIFGRFRRRKRFLRYRGEGPLESYRALNVGDYVVHVDHGIGRYGGVEKITVDGRETECLLIYYQGGDKLYVPIDQLDLVQKYIGKDGEPPSLSKLGGVSWERIKARTKKAIREMAEELIRIYALRQAKPGYAFSPDTRWQRELEASFIYDETPDQLRTIEEIKRDMEAPKPMDRLVCGDVGYGKTEVAIRAAFKAVMDAKQVAVLAPTTVLAQQHYHTFKERLSEYPVIVEMLSRFKTPRQQKAIIEGLREGRIDIVIGTHRLLQKDVQFKDLGLVIIDEEQRFGVAHKEKFKKLRATVDVLTLTATPIPRTLHLALMGARDMSIMDTPPKGRLPVETEVVQFDEEVIVNAVLRELDRGGQVFFVHNRVETIDSMAAYLQEILPNVRIAVAHGQMKERELEKVMLDFINRKYDVLVSTMIVESGLDIPNVNTIIVNNAETLGLAQLYQLRGRVGRSRHKAYAYLLVPKRKRLTDVQRKRLKTLMEFTELGSGMKVAMRDLEIRGCGNILGPEQSGYVAEVGFDLYCKLLEEAVKEIKGEPIEPRLEAKVETDISALIPETYVEDEKQRVVFYRKLVDARTQEDVDELEAELRDRYGVLPPQASNLLDFQRIRIGASKAGIERVVVKRSRIFLEMRKDRRISIQALEGVIKQGIDVELHSGETGGIEVKEVPEGERQRLAVVRKVLNALLGL